MSANAQHPVSTKYNLARWWNADFPRIPAWTDADFRSRGVGDDPHSGYLAGRRAGRREPAHTDEAAFAGRALRDISRCQLG